MFHLRSWPISNKWRKWRDMLVSKNKHISSNPKHNPPAHGISLQISSPEIPWVYAVFIPIINTFLSRLYFRILYTQTKHATEILFDIQIQFILHIWPYPIPMDEANLYWPFGALVAGGNVSWSPVKSFSYFCFENSLLWEPLSWITVFSN